jgi:cytochrome c oxidase subunit IV
MERDDIIEYSLHNHHSEEEGKKIRKKIFMVTAILSIITIVEVGIGIFFSRSFVTGLAWESIKWFYVLLTIVKAAYIVMTFMHLGDENKNLKYLILIPYSILIGQLIIIGLLEGTAVGQSFLNYGV